VNLVQEVVLAFSGPGTTIHVYALQEEVVQVTLALPMEDENLSECDQEGSCPIR
jgi:hypothetical protein